MLLNESLFPLLALLLLLPELGFELLTANFYQTPSGLVEEVPWLKDSSFHFIFSPSSFPWVHLILYSRKFMLDFEWLKISREISFSFLDY